MNNELSDLEKTRLCAEAMGYRVSDESQFEESGLWCHLPAQHGEWYRPLSGDLYGNAQCFALVKRFGLTIYCEKQEWRGGTRLYWEVDTTPPMTHYPHGPNLNQAVVDCVAKMELAKMQGSPR